MTIALKKPPAQKGRQCDTTGQELFHINFQLLCWLHHKNETQINMI